MASSRPKLMIMDDDEDTFRYYTLVKRVPGLIRGVVTDNNLTGEKAEKLERLALEFEGEGEGKVKGPSTPLDHDGYKVMEEYWGKMWRKTPWLHGECYMYHVVAEIMEWKTNNVDYFTKNKDKSVEVCLPAIHTACEGIAKAAPTTETLIKGSLWGNKVDLCLFSDSDTSRMEATDDADIIVNNVAEVVTHVEQSSVKDVHFIADNYGYELFNDLLLIDHLAKEGKTCTIHCKDMPYFVSDTLVKDVIRFAAFLAEQAHEATATFGKRIQSYLESGALKLATNPFWAAPLEFTDMPAAVKSLIAASHLTFIKGDLNYRKLVGDRHWARDHPFDEVVSYFPSPLCSLRTAKSEACVGIAKEVQDRLEALQPWPKWGCSGDFGVIHFWK